jgi:flavin-dependent dehydrogenase
MIDLAIIGGGPAGASAAMESLRRGLSVAIYERDRFPRDKVCGEFISAESLPLLESAIPDALKAGARILSAEFVSQRGRTVCFPLPKPSLGLSRRALDQALWQSAVAHGALAMEAMLVRRVSRSGSQGNATWEIESSNGERLRARALLVACGRWWKLEGLSSPADPSRRSSAGDWMGVKTHFRGMASRGQVEVYFFPGGYCGLAPVEGGLYNACCLLNRSLSRKASGQGAADFRSWLGKIARSPALDERLKCSSQSGPVITTAPVRLARREAVQDGALRAGDAAGFLDPFTGDGISMALHGGRLAAREIANALSAKPETSLGADWNGYRRYLAASTRASYSAAGLVRILVQAPGLIQEFAAAAMPASWLSSLFHKTRWCEPAMEPESPVAVGIGPDTPLLGGENSETR